jgi:hypothetical protein
MLLASVFAGARPAQAAGVAPPTRLPSPQEVLQRIKSQVIVRFKDGVSADRANAAVRATGGAVTKSLAFNNTKLAVYSSDTAGAGGLAALNANPDVVYAFYNKRIKLPGDQSQVDLTSGKAPRQLGTSAPATRPAATRPASRTEYERRVAAAAASADPLRGFQYHLDRIGASAAGTPEASAPTVAVIDSGMDYTNPDLAANYQRCPEVPGLKCDLVGWDSDPFDTFFHGTMVAGTIAARADGAGTTGVSPNSKILPVRIFGDQGYTDLLTIFQALDYTANAKVQVPSLRVANMSFGGYFLAGEASLQEFNVRMANMKRAGILPVVSAGNDSDLDLQLFPLIYGRELRVLPAQSPYALAVAATDQNDYRTFFSNYNTPVLVNNCERFRTPEYEDFKICAPDNTYTKKEYRFAPVAAPGWEILAPAPHGQYLSYGGTSFSSPIVAGVAARIFAKYPGLTVQQAIFRVGATGAPLGIGKGFPRVTRRVDLQRALGFGRTGFTGRVVDGVSGQPLQGATVILRSGSTEVARAQTNGSGFYTVTGARGGETYTLTAAKSSGQRYIAKSITAVSQGGRLAEPGTLAVAPLRDDFAYTIMLEWKNVATGYYELYTQDIATWYGEDYFGKPYPVPVKAQTMPLSFLDAAFSVPFPNEPADSTTYSWYYPGVLNAFPYATVLHDSELDLSPHEGTIVRQLPPDQQPFRYGVDFYSPGGIGRPGAVVTVYRGGTRLLRSELARSLAPNDGTKGLGRGGGTGYSQWGLYDLRNGYGLRAKANNPNGMRSDYREWVDRTNDIRGQRGPGLGGKVLGRLEPGDYGNVYSSGAPYDYVDVYRVQLQEGKTYYFDLRGPAYTNFGLDLYAPGSLSINDWEGYLTSGGGAGPREVLKYTVKPGKGGQYYILAYAYDGVGQYSLALTDTDPR